ncbi:MAG: glycosyltransferase family 2 protein, partial [Moheibacter sp.]
VSVNMPKISIIIPIYNVTEYLNNCLNSVVNQTYKNLEIILVNDGSTDDSAEKAQKYTEKDKRFRLVHRENGGLSAARNTGLSYAKGEFVFYLDSDDYLKNDCFEKLISAQDRYNADIVQTNFYYDYPSYLLYGNWLKKESQLLDREQTLERLIEQNEIKNFAWGKLIRSEIAKRNLFPEGKYFEDTLWMYRIVSESKRYVLLAEPLMYYFQRTDSISGNFSIRNLDQLELESQRLDLIKTEHPALYKKVLKKFNQKIIQHISLLPNLNETDSELYRNQLNHYRSKYELKKQFPLDYTVSQNSVLNLIAKGIGKIKTLLGSDSNHWITINKKSTDG